MQLNQSYNLQKFDGDVSIYIHVKLKSFDKTLKKKKKEEQAWTLDEKI